MMFVYIYIYITYTHLIIFRLTYHEKMAYIERALQNVPDRDSSSPSSQTSDEAPSRTSNISTTGFSPYPMTKVNSGTPTYTRSRKSTPGISDGMSMATASSTPQSVNSYTRTRHHFSVAAPIDTYETSHVTTPRSSVSTSIVQQERAQSAQDQRRRRQRGHSAEVSVDQLLGTTQGLSLFKTSSLENIANAPGLTAIASAVEEIDHPPIVCKPIAMEQQFYNLDLDLDLLVQPHIRAVTAPMSSNTHHYSTTITPSTDGRPPKDYAIHQNNIDIERENRQRSRDRTKRRERKHSRSTSPIKTTTLSVVGRRDLIGRSSTPSVMRTKPTSPPSHRRSRSTERPLSSDPVALVPMSLALFSPSGNLEKHRFEERYPKASQFSLANTSELQTHLSHDHQVPFFNITTRKDVSDTDSLNSFSSEASSTDFRPALRSNHAGSTPPPLSQKLHLYPNSRPSASVLSSATNTVKEKLHRPVAMVTRETQAPTPTISASKLRLVNHTTSRNRKKF